jgi:hypothetical protein
MTRSLLGLAGALVVAGSIVTTAAQNPPPPPQTQPPTTADQTKDKDVTITGCLTQGSSPTSFILNNARLSTDDKSKPGKTYQVIADSSAKGVDLKTHVGHEISLVGAAEMKAAPVPAPGQKIDDKDWPKLNAKTLSMISDRCTSAN